jgi:hypothetical protein
MIILLFEYNGVGPQRAKTRAQAIAVFSAYSGCDQRQSRICASTKTSARGDEIF